MSEAFGRAAVIEFGEPPPAIVAGVPGPETTKGLRVDSLRCEFSVKRTLSEDPNTADLVVYNLNPSHRKLCQDLAKANAGALVRIQAGYGSDIGLIFSGVCNSVTERYEGSTQNWATHFSCEDGAEKDVDHPTRKDKKVKATIDLRLAKGTPIPIAVQKVVEAAGLKLAALTKALPLTLPSGAIMLPYAVALKGPRIQQMSRFLNSCGLVWSVQNGVVEGQLIGLPFNPVGPLLSVAGTLLHAETDMKGDVAGACKLDHRLAPGMLTTIAGMTVKGAYTLDSVEHHGDTGAASTTWETSFSGFPL